MKVNVSNITLIFLGYTKDIVSSNDLKSHEKQHEKHEGAHKRECSTSLVGKFLRIEPTVRVTVKLGWLLLR